MRSINRLGFASLLLMLVCGRAAGADDALAKAKAEEIEKLQGTWLIVSAEFYGEEYVEGHRGRKLVVTGTKMKWFHSGEKDSKFEEFEFELDPTKSPKQIDIKQSTRTVKAIYTLDGDNFRFCIGDEQRPTELVTKDKPYGIWGFKRLRRPSEE